MKVSFKVHIFWEGHTILQNLHQLFVLCTASQIIGGDFEKNCGLLKIYELVYSSQINYICKRYITVKMWLQITKKNGKKKIKKENL